MTLTELNQHLELLKTLSATKEMLQSLRDAAYPGAAVITGMPHTPGVKDKVGDLASEIADAESDLEQIERQVKASEELIAPFIFAIDDVQTRFIFRLRFLRGLTWKEVAAVVGGRNSEESVKMVCYRYFGS